MFTEPFDKKIITLPVKSLQYNQSDNQLIESIMHDVVQVHYVSNAKYKCMHSDNGWLNLTALSADINQLHYLRINDLKSIKPKMLCEPSNATFGEPYHFYYLGYADGVFNIGKGRSFKDPRFFYHITKEHRLVMTVVGKFYPCVTSALNVYNAKATPILDRKPTNLDKLDVTTDGQFRPYWPHYFMAKHGETLTTSIIPENDHRILFHDLTIQGNMVWTEKLNSITDQIESKIYANADIVVGPHEKAHVQIKFTVEPEYWQAVVDAYDPDWQKIFNSYYPTSAKPFLGIPTHGLGQKLTKGIDNMHIYFYTKHGNRELGAAGHNGKPSYRIKARGQFYNNTNMPSHLFRGLHFKFAANGERLQNATLDFELTKNQCINDDRDPLSRHTRIHGLWTHMRANALQKPGQTKKYIVEDVETYDGDHKCPKNQFRFARVEFTGLDETMSKSTITISFIDNRFGRHTRITCTAYMKIQTFIAIMQQAA
ncbi:uncharacterized protein [Clytia hemisphaerica]|uniref:uncharacterized protein n=1 Tax=Clytia hemisphaerica TaxID=252671 RepID=UPI0034D724EA